ncbi:MAG: hypothetical protein R2704_16115 [Microthrixaceae bacterium]
MNPAQGGDGTGGELAGLPGRFDFGQVGAGLRGRARSNDSDSDSRAMWRTMMRGEPWPSARWCPAERFADQRGFGGINTAAEVFELFDPHDRVA